MEEHVDTQVETHSSPAWVPAGIVIVGILAVAGLALGWHDYNSIDANQRAAATEMKAAHDNDVQQIAALEKKVSQDEETNATLESDLGVVTKSLRLTEGQLKQARQEATKLRSDNEQRLSALDTNVSSVKTELATKASSDDLTAVNGTVTNVKADLDTTKNDLKMARSELGTLIARNHEQIDVLRRMGERDYTEFAIQGRGKPQKVGGITVELRSVDAKRNRFSVNLVVNDVRTENKNQLVNQPIVFYPNGNHQADEFVVNSISKDKITGYISAPKNPGLASASITTN
jgi:DNA repair exonuclease SbcCD ATPase subunit